ncbi:MAG TPA: selenide, water dikinase SelD [Vicinamibacterales bacterium]|nr:selenide, water dikinase SelD [Vicinamibacterales bacterium]
MPKRLTEYADCAGCASKLAAAELETLMDDLPVSTDSRVLVDYRTADDAGVYRWAAGPALVQTVDFFTPIVDDPFVFGQIAAANALSDVYAMGGTPRTALAIAALPARDGPAPDDVKAIFRGGLDVLGRAGVALLGGHTVTDPEVKFGYSVTGEVDPGRMLTNAGARAGDAIILTKPLGTGVIVRARKYGQGSDALLAGAVQAMTTLNAWVVDAVNEFPDGTIRACTDVTGFGLIGHATEMAAASDVTISFDSTSLPVLPGALELVTEFLPCGGRANLSHFRALEVGESVERARHLLALDPQTSGGLLVAVDVSRAAALLSWLGGRGVAAARVGTVGPADGHGIRVRLG